MVIAPAKKPWHIDCVDVLVDVVFLAQPLCGARVDRHFGEGTLPTPTIRTDTPPPAATAPARGRLAPPVARTFVGPAGQRPCSPGVRCRRARVRYQTPAPAAGQPPRAARGALSNIHHTA